MKIYIREGEVYSKPLLYVFALLGVNKSTEITFVETLNEAQIIADHEHPGTIPINKSFYELLINNKIYNHSVHFKEEAIIKTGEGKKDYLASAFYMINAFQEYGATKDDLDEIGRFKYSSSYQHKFNCIENNLVQEYFDNFYQKYLPQLSVTNNSRNTKIFLSHDIDSVNGALFQDGFYNLKKANFPAFFKLAFNAIMKKPDWLNMDKIVKIENDYDFKSAFFWLVNKGKVNNRETNADYNIRSGRIINMIKLVEDNKSENGLHKSIANDSFKTEMEKSGINPVSNRYHYLKFNLPNAFNDIEEAGLQLDASLGFAEHYGFRNNYGQPFQPYNPVKEKAYDFVEVPLNIMDGTFQRYMKISKQDIAQKVIDFFEKNRYNCILSVLWHNTFFSDYKYNGYKQVYIDILSYFYESKIESITPSQMIKQFKWKGN